MQDDVERVARAINAANGCPDYMWKDWVVDARAAMAATLELAAEAARECAAESAGSGYAHHMDSAADWLQQRANDVKEAGNYVLL